MTFKYDFQVWLPHVAADVLQALCSLFTEPTPRAHEATGRSICPNPEQALAVLINLVHDREVFVPTVPKNLVHADGK